VSNSTPQHERRFGLLVVGHGSRDPRANDELLVFVEHVRRCCPEADVRHAYIELATPALADGLDALAGATPDVVVAPVALLNAGHVKNDIPLALAAARRRHPGVRFIAAPPLGVHATLLEVAGARLAEGVLDHDPADTVVVAVGRGSSDADANGDFCKVARLLGEGRGFADVQPCFIGVTTPDVEATLERVARARPGRVVVAPYFLFDGRLLDRLRTQVAAFARRYPWIRTHQVDHLGPAPEIAAVLVERARAARAGAAPLPCDACQYRTAISGVSQHVGGLQALLWSVRHSMTHTSAAPHEHAHLPLAKHVLVCGNVDCAKGGSIALINGLRRAIKRAGRQRDIRVTRTSCMGRCGEGPTMAVYPDGIWYRAVQEQDAEELVREHLLQERLVARLVDNIMQ
jgi:sirohydrochlorin cobaltochelatase